MLSSFKILEENKSLRKFYEGYFIEKFQPLLYKSFNVVVFNMASTSPRQHQISKTKWYSTLCTRMRKNFGKTGCL